MEFLPTDIERYALEHSKPELPVLTSLSRETWSKVLRPRMLSGHLQGKVLEFMSCMIQPSRILEIGTYTGYSAICLAQGLKSDGRLFTIDINDEIIHFAERFIEQAGLSHKISLLSGDARTIIPDLGETWDMVFIDADKENYRLYFDLVIDKVRPGGFIIADNVLWSGKVLADYPTMDEETKSLVDFNNFIVGNEKVDNVLLPVRDGLMVIRKK